jgi:hypothetical protein
MNKPDENQASSDVDNVRRKLLKLGIYSVPAILLIGKVTGARASGTVRGKNDNGGDTVTNGSGDVTFDLGKLFEGQ